MVKVPGPDGKRGFGGKCLPKDIRAFSTIHNSELVSKIIEYNNSLRDDLHKFEKKISTKTVYYEKSWSILKSVDQKF